MHHEYDVTIRGIHHWSRCLFNSFGCIILAHHRKHDSRVVAYHDSVKDLLKTIEYRLEHVHDADKKEDLQIIHEHVKMLKFYTDKLFTVKSETSKTSKTKTKKTKNIVEADN